MAARGSSGSDRSVFSRLKSRLYYRNVFPSLPSSATSSGSVTSTAHSSDGRPMQVVSRVVEEDCRALAHPDSATRHTSRLDRQSSSIQSTVRFSNFPARQAERSRSLQGNTSALSRHRFSGAVGRSVRDSRGVVRSLSSSKERHRQGARMHRSHNHQSLSLVRALQDGGSAHRSGSAPP